MYTRDRKNLRTEEHLLHFKNDFDNTNWTEIMDIDKQDPNLSFNNFYNSIENLLDKYPPLRKVTKKEFKRKFKPWITQ